MTTESGIDEVWLGVAGEQLGPRSHVKKGLDKIEAVLDNRATKEIEESTIEGVMIKRIPHAELVAMRSKYLNWYLMGPYSHSQLASIIASGADAKHHIDNVEYIFWEGLEHRVPISFFVTPLGGMGMKAISADVRLDNCYYYSEAPDLSHFLSLGFSKRLRYRNYGKSTEAKLMAELENWIRQRIAIITESPMPAGEEFNTSNTISSTRVTDYETIVNSPNPERFFSDTESKSLWAELEAGGFLEENIYYLYLPVP